MISAAAILPEGTSMTAPVASGWSDLAGWDSHPLESAAFARRTRRAAIADYDGLRRSWTDSRTTLNREGRRVVVDPDVDPACVGGQIRWCAGGAWRHALVLRRLGDSRRLGILGAGVMRRAIWTATTLELASLNFSSRTFGRREIRHLA